MVTVVHYVLLFIVVTIQNGLWHASPPGGSFLDGPCLVQKVDFFFFFFSPLLSGRKEEEGGGVLLWRW